MVVDVGQPHAEGGAELRFVGQKHIWEHIHAKTVDEDAFAMSGSGLHW